MRDFAQVTLEKVTLYTANANVVSVAEPVFTLVHKHKNPCNSEASNLQENKAKIVVTPFLQFPDYLEHMKNKNSQDAKESGTSDCISSYASTVSPNEIDTYTESDSSSNLSPFKNCRKFDFFPFSKNCSLIISKDTVPTSDVLNSYGNSFKTTEEIIQLVPANRKGTDYSLSEKGKKLHLANSCYISDSSVEKLRSLKHTKPIKSVAQISFEQATSNIPIVNSVYLAESTIAFTGD